jgi:hypothetical protein
MSQEQPPVRSRRELRQARDARLDETRDTGAQAPGQVPPVSARPAAPQPEDSPDTDGQDTGSTGRVRRVATEPVDSVRASAERSSQIRARDRAALRTIKELAEKEEQLSAGGPPTRRQLRLQQLRAEASPATAANPVIPASRGGANAPAEGNKPRRQESPAAASAERYNNNTDPGDGFNVPDGMTVEQALATRTFIAEQAKNQLAKMEHIAANDPEAVDPEILAQQIALAERAAVLNKRAMAKQKLAEQATAPQQPRHDPSAASNLAMVTPLEFVQVPGIDRPVMKKPATSYVPVVTHPGPRVPAERQAGPRKPGAPRLNSSGPITGRSGVLARAEAVAQASSPPAPAAPQTTPVSVQRRQTWDTEVEENFTEHRRISANEAYGLEPLDAVTAGLGRAHRLRLLQLAVLAIGIVALIAGVTMIVSGLTR